jgi:ribonuclease P protein component
VGKKLGGAVARNRVRRRLREAYRLLYPSLAGGYDLVIVGRTRAKDVRFRKLLEEMKSLLKQAGALTR